MDNPHKATTGHSGDPLRLSPRAKDLLERAHEHHLGRDFLLEGDPESVAVIHSVHPFVVHEVRDFLSRSGGDPR